MLTRRAKAYSGSGLVV